MGCRQGSRDEMGARKGARDADSEKLSSVIGSCSSMGDGDFSRVWV